MVESSQAYTLEERENKTLLSATIRWGLSQNWRKDKARRWHATEVHGSQVPHQAETVCGVESERWLPVTRGGDDLGQGRDMAHDGVRTVTGVIVTEGLSLCENSPRYTVKIFVYFSALLPHICNEFIIFEWEHRVVSHYKFVFFCFFLNNSHCWAVKCTQDEAYSSGFVQNGLWEQHSWASTWALSITISVTTGKVLEPQ